MGFHHHHTAVIRVVVALDLVALVNTYGRQERELGCESHAVVGGRGSAVPPRHPDLFTQTCTIILLLRACLCMIIGYVVCIACIYLLLTGGIVSPCRRGRAVARGVCTARLQRRVEQGSASG